MMINGTSVTRFIQQPQNQYGGMQQQQQQQTIMTSGTPPVTTMIRNTTPMAMSASQLLRQQQQPGSVSLLPQSANRTYQTIAPKSTYSPTQNNFTPTITVNSTYTPCPAIQNNNINDKPRLAPILQSSNKQKQPNIYPPPATSAPVSASFRKNPTIVATSTPGMASGVEQATILQQAEVTAGTQTGTNAFNPKDKGQNAKTFPSLVVIVKPYLQEKLSKAQAAAVRSDLDSKVKTILMQSPVEFTEWLIQKGLLKMDHKCSTHNTSYKLGMYSDSEKYPFSGGYVFTVDCCQDKQLSVFQGSIFEASVYPPETTMKLIYHWACQTPAPSVLQWVKVTSYYLKNFYTLLRSVCVAALHENVSVMGGKGKYIEVGVVTLRTLPGAQPGSKNTKIEILGVFDPGAKFIRMRLLNCTPGLGGDQAKRERIDQILTLLSHWVSRESVLLIDCSLDRSMVEKLGFRNISQPKAPVGAPAKTTIPTNVNVMNYLKNIVPNMFQNTLCVLSKSLIQQFLDELSWRELFGPHPLKAFVTAVLHLVGMTKADTGDLLIPRLNKISLNPFTEWSYTRKTFLQPSGIECLPDSIRAQPLSELVASAVGMDSTISSFVSSYMNTNKNNAIAVKYSNNKTGNNSTIKTVAIKRKAEEEEMCTNLQKLLAEGVKSHTLQAYYYIYCPSPLEKYRIEFQQNLKCPLCNKVVKSNQETISHLCSHILSAGRIVTNPHACRYCLKELATPALLDQHIKYGHRKEGERNVCKICSKKFPSEQALIFHMWRRHVQCEAPYRCEVCEYRTSFHYDVIDHFYKEHGTSDTVICPVCTKTFPVRSINCLKNVVAHLQNHILKKGKRCQDCYLSFFNDSDYRAHLIGDSAHESRRNKNFVQHEVEDTPIRMPKPPIVNKDVNLPPPAKKNKSQRTAGSNQSNLQTLNSSFAVPLNPSDRYMFTPMKLKIGDIDVFAGMNCWECFKPINLPGHYRGTIKCSRCRFETCCSFTIQKHIKTHDATKLNQTIVRTKLALSREADLASDALECSGCYFVSGSTRRFAYHLLNTGHKSCSPKNRTSTTTSEQVVTGTGTETTVADTSSDGTI